MHETCGRTADYTILCFAPVLGFGVTGCPQGSGDESKLARRRDVKLLGQWKKYGVNKLVVWCFPLAIGLGVAKKLPVQRLAAPVETF